MSQQRLGEEEPRSATGKNAGRKEKKDLLQLILQEDKDRVIIYSAIFSVFLTDIVHPNESVHTLPLTKCSLSQSILRF